MRRLLDYFAIRQAAAIARSYPECSKIEFANNIIYNHKFVGHQNLSPVRPIPPLLSLSKFKAATESNTVFLRLEYR